MIGQPKPLASLSSTLLARKGQARPAMRPQGFGGFGTIPGGTDDLGWNDMGHAEPAPVEQPYVAQATVAPVPPVLVPPVLVQREALEEEFTPPPPVAAVPAPAPETVPEPVPLRPVSVATAQRLSRETATRQPKAAFTLRLDHDRHLRLRIASALLNRSAQHLVTEALDQLLDSLPEVDALVRQLPGAKKN